MTYRAPPLPAVVVWRPGAASSGNTFATWAEIVRAVSEIDGAVSIALDTDLAAAVIPPGNYDLRPVGVSGPVEFVNASKAPPFPAPFFTIGPGAVTIKGLSGLDDVQLDNQSTVPVIAIAANGSFAMHRRAAVFQTGVGPFWAITGGAYALVMADTSQITVTGGPAVALTVAAPGGLLLTIEDNSMFDTNMMTAAAGTVAIAVSPGAKYASQAGAPAITPTFMQQAGSAAIDGVTGKTPAITAFISASSKILVSVKTPANDGATKGYAALSADRIPGSPGSFKISALDNVAGGGGVNLADTSTVDWEVIQSP